MSESQDNGGVESGPPDLQRDLDPNHEGWKETRQAAFEYAWEEKRRGMSGEAVYRAEIYVKGSNPISGYRVILTP
jgi:hypothetical protein